MRKAAKRLSQFIAHIISETAEAQTVTQHLQGTAALARCFAQVFGFGELGFRCGMLHDIGKYSDAFQKRIRGSTQRVDHSTAGAKEAFSSRDIPAALCVAGHHGGLPDFGNPRVDKIGESSLISRIKKTLPDYSAFSQEITVPKAVLPKDFGRDGFSDSFFIRMLFSCLVDADFLDTEAFMNKNHLPRGEYEPLSLLLERLERYIAPWLEGSAKSTLDFRRCNILSSCLKGGDEKPGLFTLTVPTGGGKTVSSAAFALRHAVKNNKKRLIYVIPYCSIIDQTVDVFSKIFGALQVTAHYSGIDIGNDDDDGVTSSEVRRRLATENWDAPIIVTTAVQFFESLFANKTSRCRKLHNIAESVIIFDEAQMLPLPYLRPCIAAISELVKKYGATAVLCTATQPSLGDLLKEFWGASLPLELCAPEDAADPCFKRVTYKPLGAVTNEALSLRLCQHKQVLCVVNSRKLTQGLYQNLDAEGAFCLTTLLTPKDRQKAFEAIRKRLSDGAPCRVVSTSLIEAGVDIDFPIVYREESGLDSIVQAAGRCNREGKRFAGDSFVYIFSSESPVPQSFRQNISAARSVMAGGAPLELPETQKKYFDFLYKIKGDEALDKKDVLKAMNCGIDGGLLPFATVAERFKLIDSDTVTVYIPKGDGKKLTDQLLNGGVTRALLRKLAPYGVSVYREHARELCQSGSAVQAENGLLVLTDMALYSDKTGLSLEAEQGKGLFF